MRLLLDTHALLWSLARSERLRAETRRAIRDSSNEVFVSAASAWEMAIKAALGKLDAPDDLEHQMRLNRFEGLPVTVRHGLAVRSLPTLHKDPFDRLLVAQGQVEGLRVVTRDPLVRQYDVEWMPA